MAHSRALAFWALLMITAVSTARADTPAAARVRLGLGFTERSVQVPSAEGPSQLSLGITPAVLLGIEGEMQSSRWRFGLGLGYRTSMLGRAADTYAGTGTNTPVRSHSFEAGLRAGMRLSAVTLGLFAGYSVRAFTSVAVLRVPRFSLHGPVLRLELVLPLHTAGMQLRLAPEAQWLASISSALRDLSQPAVALGAEAQLELPLSAALDLQLLYRESHVWARTAFRDVERYLLLGAAYRMP